MTTIFKRMGSYFVFAILVAQMPNTGWAMENDNKQLSLVTTPYYTKKTVVSEDEQYPFKSYTRSPQIEFDDDINFSQYQSPRMPFKLGFEFQVGTLCEWALENNNLQKKPIFFVRDQQMSKLLWKLVLDTSDIEFVTEPFTDQDLLGLERCIDSILLAFNDLRKYLSNQEEVTFEAWVNSINLILSQSSFSIEFSDSNSVSENKAIYELIKDKALKRPEVDWEPEFSPQVTIQHPLERTIPLYFGLFGFDSPRYMFPFSASLPYRDVLLAAQKEGNSAGYFSTIKGYCEKEISGLVFLHALTLVQMAPLAEKTDTEFLKETLENYNKYRQIDPKMRLSLMSRRPFSSMFKDLQLGIKYEEGFMHVMGKNSSFMNDIKFFSSTNYAEQFFDEQSGQIKPLKNYFPLFQTSFSQDNVTLENLLGVGIMSTAMLRNFKEDVMTNDAQPISKLNRQYFSASIKSVTKPQNRYIIVPENVGVESQVSQADAVSPPWYLDLSNSMGAYKDEILPEDKKYGKAIVEVRAIRYVQPWFLKKAGLNIDVKDNFLTQPSDLLKSQAVALWGFLRGFGTEQDMSDITLGMTYSVLKF